MPQLSNKSRSDEGNVTSNLNSSNTTTSVTVTGSLTGTIANSALGTYTGGVTGSTQIVQRAKPTQSKKSSTGWTLIDREFDPATNMNELWESPVNGREVFIASLTLSDAISRHHFELFTRLHPAVEWLVCGISQMEGMTGACAMTNIIFTNRCDFELFENWFAEYLELFGSKEALYSHMLPPPPTQMNYSYQVTLHKQSNLLETCLWFRENCVGNVYYLGNRLFFLNDEDAQLYRLKFC